MKKNWVWLVLAIAIAFAVCLFVRARIGQEVDEGPSISEMASGEDFEKVPPTGSEMNLDEMSVSFDGVTNKVDKGKAVK